MKFRAAVLNKVNEPLTLDTLEMAQALVEFPRFSGHYAKPA